MIQIPTDWQDYELIDAGEEEKLERWGKYILRRPDPQAIWGRNQSPEIQKIWSSPDMFYHRSNKGGGFWEGESDHSHLREWVISYKNLKFNVRPTAFKHTGLFPEQASNWEWLINKISNDEVRMTNEKDNSAIGIRQSKILNLFAYTGGATVACMSTGAHVTHVDASKGMSQVAKENIEISKLDSTKVRFIVDDAVKFVEREIRRGNKYDGIIMDPPVYGRGPTGELWEIEKDLTKLVELCSQILSEKPLFFLINAYATTFSHVALKNILELALKEKLGGSFTSGELGLKMSSRDLVLPCGLFARWERS